MSKSKFSTAPDHRFVGASNVEYCELCGKLRAVHADDGFVPNREMTNIERQFWNEKRDYFRTPGSEPKV
jgi:hypothetical protein